MLFCVHLLLVLCVTSSLAIENRFSRDSSDKSSNNPLIWMMIKQIGRTETRLNEVQKQMKEMQFEIDGLKKRCSLCPDDLMPFSGHCYWFVYKKVSWNIAKNECQQKGGYLVKVESGAENSWLISALKAEVWIGLNDIQTEGQWKWVSDNTGISFSYWPSHEPNGGTRENCVQYCKERCHRKDYGWNDESCGSQMGYVCEKEL